MLFCLLLNKEPEIKNCQVDRKFEIDEWTIMILKSIYFHFLVFTASFFSQKEGLM